MRSVLGILSVLWVTSYLSDASAGDIQHQITTVLENNPSLKAEHNEGVYKTRLAQFRQFVKEFNRDYETESELKLRFKSFLKNMEVVDLMNNGEKGTAKYGFTEHSDASGREVQRMQGLCENGKEFLTGNLLNSVPEEDRDLFREMLTVGNKTLHDQFGANTLKRIDWREKHIIGPVLKQGYCTSSYAYAIITALESYNALLTGKFQRLSKQQLIDCDKIYNFGCCGGTPHNALVYLKKIGGLELDKTYNGRTFVRSCHFKPENIKVIIEGVRLFSNISIEANEEFMAYYLSYNGAIAVGINAQGLIHYKGGIIKQDPKTCANTAKNINHFVSLVGFDEKDGIKYWIVKNSWGKNWGEKGYFRIQRGNNTCGIGIYGVAGIVLDTGTGLRQFDKK